MKKQLKSGTPKCEICCAKIGHSLLVSAVFKKEWTLMLCSKKVKEKLKESGSLESDSEELYKRFSKNFDFFLSCPSFECKLY